MFVVLPLASYLASLMYIIQQNVSGTIYAVCSTPLPFTTVSGILNAHFENFSTLTAITLR